MYQCPNCKMNLSSALTVCPCCGSTYFDLTATNMASRKPFYIRVKTEMGDKPCYLTAKVVPDLFSIESVEKIVPEGGWRDNSPIFKLKPSRGVDLSLDLQVVEDKGTMFTLEMEE